MAQELKMADKSIVPVEQFLSRWQGKEPPHLPLLAVAAGAYRVNFRFVNCIDCGGANLLRHYCVKSLAIVRSSDQLGCAQQCVQLAAMDGVALAKEFMNSPLWIASRERGTFIGLGTLYLPSPKWISDCNAIVAIRIEELAGAGEEFPPVAAFIARHDEGGRKCLRAVCRHCNSSLSISDSSGPIHFSFTLRDLDGE